MSVEPIFVTVKEAQRILGLSRSTIYEMLAAGELTRVKRGRNTLIQYAEIRRVADEMIRQSA